MDWKLMLSAEDQNCSSFQVLYRTIFHRKRNYREVPKE